MKASVNKLRRNVKALSPIFAVLILIAIAVIAGIIVYMFTSGYLGTMMGGGTAGQEKVAIQTVNATAPSVTIWAKSTGGGPVNVTEVILKNAAGQALEVKDLSTEVTLPSDGTLKRVDCTFEATNCVSGTVYTVALVTREGNQFVSPTFKP